MATIQLNIPDKYLDRVIDGIAYHNGYTDEIEDPEDRTKIIPNPETKQEFCKKMLIKWVKGCVEAWEIKQAVVNVPQTVKDDVNKINIS